MRILEKLTVIIFCAALLAFCGDFYFDRMYTDNTAPVIRSDSSIIYASVNASEEELKNNPRARSAKLRVAERV